MLPTVVFDVNETLLDLAPVRTWFGTEFDDPSLASAWFDELLRLSFVSSVTDRYVPLTELAGHALTSTVRHDVDAETMNQIRSILTTLPAHPDVIHGLTMLTEAGYSIAALTNSPRTTAVAQLTNAGIAETFDLIMSVDMVQRFKPHHSVYEAAAEHLSIQPSSLIMVAAHDWDVAGAMATGCSGVFITRGGRTYSPAFPDPDASVPDIAAAAGWIVDESKIEDR
jgi:2-haloacid dehalogenase